MYASKTNAKGTPATGCSLWPSAWADTNRAREPAPSRSTPYGYSCISAPIGADPDRVIHSHLLDLVALVVDASTAICQAKIETPDQQGIDATVTALARVLKDTGGHPTRPRTRQRGGLSHLHKASRPFPPRVEGLPVRRRPWQPEPDHPRRRPPAPTTQHHDSGAWHLSRYTGRLSPARPDPWWSQIAVLWPAMISKCVAVGVLLWASLLTVDAQHRKVMLTGGKCMFEANAPRIVSPFA